MSEPQHRLRNYACKTTVRGQEYTSGCYDISMLNAVVRLIGENWTDFKIEEESSSRWIVKYGTRMWIIEDVEPLTYRNGEYIGNKELKQIKLIL